MARTTIAWGDGSGDNIYLDYSTASGNQTVAVSSDANTGAARTKTITFSASGASAQTLTVSQEAGTVPGTMLPWQAMTHPANNRSSQYLDVLVQEGDIITVKLTDYATWRFAIVVLTEGTYGRGSVVSDTGWKTTDITKTVTAAESGYYLRITISRRNNASFPAADGEAALAEATALRPD